MSRVRFSLIAAVLALPVLVGCGADEGGPDAAPDLPADPSGLTLITDGAEPREPLRLDLEPGGHRHATMTMANTVTSIVDGQRAPAVQAPETSTGMSFDIGDREGGETEIAFGYDDIEVDGTGAQAAAVEQALRGLGEVTGSITLSELGELVEGGYQLPEGLDPAISSTLDSLESQLQSLTVPLPAKPVGVGAVWTAEVEAEVNGITSVTTARYRLVERDGDRVVLAVRLDQSAAEQDVDLPTLPPGVTAHLQSLSMSGSARTILDLGSPVPASMRSQMAGASRMVIADGVNSSQIESRTRVRVRLSED